jgi:hypothetical protein
VSLRAVLFLFGFCKFYSGDNFTFIKKESRYNTAKPVSRRIKLNISAPVKTLFLRSELPEDPAGWYRQMDRLSPSKTAAEILVHRSLL